MLKREHSSGNTPREVSMAVIPIGMFLDVNLMMILVTKIAPLTFIREVAPGMMTPVHQTM